MSYFLTFVKYPDETRVHSGEEFIANDFPSDEEGREAWETWKQITRHGYVPGESAREIA